jgi:hypothetical protein
MRRILTLAVTVSTVFLSVGASGATWYVDVSVPKPGDGTSWQKALKEIQAGIDKATNGDTVIVAQGTYVENINFGGKNIVLTSTEPGNWGVVGKTIIDGNKAGSVVTLSATQDETCILSGLTIRNGTGTIYPGVGGPTAAGGGIYGGDPLGQNHNHATIENNIITANSAEDGGGLVGCDGLIHNNMILANSAGKLGPKWHGGAMCTCHGIIQNNLIAGNSGGCGGGVSYCDAIFCNNTVVGNVAVQEGGGVSHHGKFFPSGGEMVNCVVWGNTSPSGAQIWDSVSPTDCFIKDWTGGGQGNLSGDPRFLDPDGPDNDPNTYGDNDYRLLPNSSCIDAGTNEDWMNGAVDLDGKPRILLGATSLTVDMGAHEYRFDFAIGRNIESNIELSWTMRPARNYTVLSSFDMMLQPWVEETTILGGKTGGPASWIDPGASPALKFYRIEIR